MEETRRGRELYYENSDNGREKRVEPTDLELWERSRQGDQRAFYALVERYGASFYRTARALVGEETQAEDVVQETWLGAYRGLAHFGGRSSLKTWLTQILVRQAAKVLARRGKEKEKREQKGRTAERGGADAHRAAEVSLDVAAALGRLSVEHRMVIVLRELQGLSYAQIAETLNVPQGTIESRIYRARQELKNLLKHYLD